jgi:hypothetical protein
MSVQQNITAKCRQISTDTTARTIKTNNFLLGIKKWLFNGKLSAVCRILCTCFELHKIKSKHFILQEIESKMWLFVSEDCQ